MKIPRIVWEDGKPLEEKTKLNLGLTMLVTGIVAVFFPFIIVVVGILCGLALLSKAKLPSNSVDGIQKGLDDLK